MVPRIVTGIRYVEELFVNGGITVVEAITAGIAAVNVSLYERFTDAVRGTGKEGLGDESSRTLRTAGSQGYPGYKVGGRWCAT